MEITPYFSSQPYTRNIRVASPQLAPSAFNHQAQPLQFGMKKIPDWAKRLLEGIVLLFTPKPKKLK